MTAKEIGKRILPPILIDAAKYMMAGRSAAGQGPSLIEWEYMPEGWAHRDRQIKGWNVPSIVETEKAKWREFTEAVLGTGSSHRKTGPLGVSHEAASISAHNYSAHNTNMAYAYVLTLAARMQERISVLDWGGGLGHYYIMSKAIIPDVEIEYYCKDLPLLCAAGRDLLPDAHFYDNDADSFGRSYDLVLASGSFQYSEDWRHLANQLARTAKSYLYITRLPVLSREDSFVVVQRPYR